MKNNLNITINKVFKSSKKYIQIDPDKCIAFPLSIYEVAKKNNKCTPDSTITFDVQLKDASIGIDVKEKRRGTFSKIDEMIEKNIAKKFTGNDGVTRLNFDRTHFELV